MLCIVSIIQFHITWKHAKFISDLFLVRPTNIRLYQRQILKYPYYFIKLERDFV